MNASAVPAHLRGQEVDVRWVMRELLDEQRVTREEFNVISTTPRENKELNWHPLQVVAKYRLVDRAHGQRIMDVEFLSDWLAAKSGLPLYHIDPLKVDVDQITRVMSYAFAERHGIVAVESHRDRVVVACDQPFKPDWQEHLKQVLGDRALEVVFANPEQLRRYRIEFYNLSRSIAGAARSGGQELSGITNFEQLLEVGKGHPDADDQHIVNIVDWILQYAFSQRASDIHLEPRRDLGKMRFRIDGVLHDVYELPATIMAAVTSRLKILSRLNVAEKRKPQDGRLKTKSPDGDEVELRISTLPTAFGEKMVMRVFDPDVLVRSFSQLGFSKEDYQHWQAMTAHTHGIVFVTGPTGSGKTTSLYAALRLLNDGSRNILTVEDPVEYAMEGVGQTQVNPKVGLTFAAGLRAILRQDPDVVMVGEIRDRETAEIAVQASLTGHLVLSTVHTNDAVGAITRMRDMKVEPFLLASTLRAVIAQRLVRRLCEQCRRPVAAEGPVAALLGFDPGTIVYEAVGCEQCQGSGFKGRVGVYEAVRVDETVRRLINDGGDEALIARHAFLHAPTLGSAARQLVREGVTTAEEAVRVSRRDMADADAPMVAGE